jgi:outer membrane protein OmpA-like peptidoglycan-associated protein
MVAVPITLALATTGCATKKFVRQQTNSVNARVNKLEAQTNDKIAYLNNQQKSDMSAVNERFSTTDQKLAEVASAAQQAQGTASRAMEEADSNSSKIAATNTAVSTLAAGTANALNYQMVEKADVLFSFDQATLTPEAKAALDQVVMKVQSLPRAVVELVGFTDPVGSKNHNLALSRQRAWAVQQYLVRQKVPVRAIHVTGLGKEPAPPGLEAEIMALNPNATTRELHRAARRVRINVFGAGDITAPTSGGQQ